MQTFSLDRFDFSIDFYAFDFFVLRDLNLSLTFTVSAAEPKWQQFTTKIRMKSAPKLVYFFTLNIINGYGGI